MDCHSLIAHIGSTILSAMIMLHRSALICAILLAAALCVVRHAVLLLLLASRQFRIYQYPQAVPLAELPVALPEEEELWELYEIVIVYVFFLDAPWHETRRCVPIRRTGTRVRARRSP